MDLGEKINQFYKIVNHYLGFCQIFKIFKFVELQKFFLSVLNRV